MLSGRKIMFIDSRGLGPGEGYSMKKIKDHEEEEEI